MQTDANLFKLSLLTNVPVTGHVVLGHVVLGPVGTTAEEMAIEYRARRKTNFQNTLRPACAYATREVLLHFPLCWHLWR
jgi:hypothetical protein